MLSVDGCSNIYEDLWVQVKGFGQYIQIALKDMSQYNHRAEAKLGAIRMNGSAEDTYEHTMTSQRSEEASLSKAVRLRIAYTVFDFDQVGILLIPCIVEINLLEKIFAKSSRARLCEYVATVKHGNTDLGQLALIMNPTLRVKTDHDHVVS